jgi:hypothetical protein
MFRLDRRKRHTLPFLLVLALVLGAAALGAGQASARPASSSALGPVPLGASGGLQSVEPEDILAVALRRSEVAKLLPNGADWWPELPEVYPGNFDPKAPGLRLWAVQSYQLVTSGKAADSRLETTVSLYRSPALASASFAALGRSGSDSSGKLIPGPRVGDEVRYFTRKRDGLVETTVRFRVGLLSGRVSVFGAREWKTQDLARYATPVLARMESLLVGKLEAPALPAATARLLPPPSSRLPVVASATVPAEAWAIVDLSGKPVQVRAFLRGNGVDTLGLRRYRLAASPGHVVEVTLFAFASSRAAEKWAHSFVDSLPKSRLDPGATGPLSGFADMGDGFYELQFAQGRFVGDVSCWAPFEKTAKTCVDSSRQLAEAWYRALSA